MSLVVLITVPEPALADELLFDMFKSEDPPPRAPKNRPIKEDDVMEQKE